MGGKIPSTIRRQVITQWLYGFSRDQIAKANQIGAGTVSEIIKQCKQKEHPDGNYSEFDLIRELSVMLKREDVDVNTFASSIRLQRKLEQKGLSEGLLQLADIILRCHFTTANSNPKLVIRSMLFGMKEQKFNCLPFYPRNLPV
jgi:hypothetical protein